MDLLGQSALILTACSFAFGVSILSRNVKNKLYLAFAAICTLISVWAFSFSLFKIWNYFEFYRFHLLFNLWLSPVTLAFIRFMVRIQDSFSKRLFELSLLTSGFLTFAWLFHYDQKINWILQWIYFSPGFVIIQIFYLMWIDRKLKRGLKRLPKLPTVGFGKRNLIYLGGLLVLITSVMDHVHWEIMSGVIPTLGNIGLSIYLFFLSQAITQQRLLNIGALFSRFVVLLIVALILTGIYTVLVSWIQNSPGLFFLNSFISSFLILALLDPLRTAVRYLTLFLLKKQHQKLYDTLLESQRKLVGVVDLGALFQAILQTVEQTLQPKKASLFLLRTEGTKFRRVRTLGKEQAQGNTPREVLANHALLQYSLMFYKKGELPILLDQVLENELDRTTSHEQKIQIITLIQDLKALECNLLIPLICSRQILGFVTVSIETPPAPWGSNWGLLSMIYPYFEEAAKTLQNMEVFVRQREKERLATLGEMAAGLAHEIRNPLGAIKGAAQFLDPAIPRPESRFLKIIIEEVDRLNRVVMQFLEYSKPNAFDFKKTDVHVLAKKTIDLLRPSLKPEVFLEFMPSHKNALVLVAPEQIQQVLLNLVQNSIKAAENTAQPSVKVFIDVEGDHAQREVLISVEDNGVGIKKENLDK
ncbi:MAG: hypothetical protein HY843_05700, partial [Bdellovibrio sp.]|nr:hypothetical protein [Bdellovibrio sp.]